MTLMALVMLLSSSRGADQLVFDAVLKRNVAGSSARTLNALGLHPEYFPYPCPKTPTHLQQSLLFFLCLRSK